MLENNSTQVVELIKWLLTLAPLIYAYRADKRARRAEKTSDDNTAAIAELRRLQQVNLVLDEVVKLTEELEPHCGDATFSQKANAMVDRGHSLEAVEQAVVRALARYEPRPSARTSREIRVLAALRDHARNMPGKSK